MPRLTPSLALALSVALAAGCVSDQSIPRQPAPPAATRPAPPAVTALAESATAVLALNLGTSQVGRASAFFVASGADGRARLVTCRHTVVGRGTLLGLPLGDGRRLDAEVVAEDPARDLALLSADGTAKVVLALADREPAAGEPVWAVTRFGVSPGVVVGPHADPETGASFLGSFPDLLPGASGGAVVDAAGRVLGVVRGAIDDDPAKVVIAPVAAVRALLAKAGTP